MSKTKATPRATRKGTATAKAKPIEPPEPTIRNRVRELRNVKASDLKPHPKNWRTHSNLQKEAISGILHEIGFAGAELAIELPDGSLQLIDGHARAEIAGDEVIPVLILDLTPKEAETVLATFDPLSTLATANDNLLATLLAGVETESQSLREMLDDLSPDIIGTDDLSDLAKDADDILHRQAVQLRPKREFIVIMCDSADDHLFLDKLLTLDMVRRGGYKLGSAFDSVAKERVVTVDRLRKAIDARCNTK